MAQPTSASPAAPVYSPSPIEWVRSTTAAFVAHQALLPRASGSSIYDPSVAHVSIDLDAINREITEHPQLYIPSAAPTDWAQWYHFRAADTIPEPIRDELTISYILVLDALNFCFWPLASYEYAELASSLKRVIQMDHKAFSAQRLLNLTPAELASWLQPLSPNQVQQLRAGGSVTVFSEGNAQHLPIPLIDARCRALNEMGAALLTHFDGFATKFVASANHSGASLVALLTAHFPTFRDHAVDPFTGAQCFFYKRAQICVADLWGAYFGRSYGQFDDISDLTCFADYRLPQLLSNIGIMNYSAELKQLIESGTQILAGSVVELSIRAHTVQAVQAMRDAVKRITGESILSIQMDWILWERGEAQLSSLPPHHRTLTVYY